MSRQRQVLELSQALSGQWTAPILLALEEAGGRFTPLQHRLDIAPARLSDNLRRMADDGLIVHLSPKERRHPLLPEYVLTEKGRLYREAASAIRHAEKDLGRGRLSAKAWNMPVLLSLDFEIGRFGDLLRALPPITPKMLSARLGELTDLGLADKRIAEQPRPAFIYELAGAARSPVHRLGLDLASLV